MPSAIGFPIGLVEKAERFFDSTRRKDGILSAPNLSYGSGQFLKP
jgi:hypothetical protein